MNSPHEIHENPRANSKLNTKNSRKVTHPLESLIDVLGHQLHDGTPLLSKEEGKDEVGKRC